MSTHPLDPVVVAQLGNLALRARRILDGLFSGRHLRRHAGSSREFSENRPYNPGDDPRSLDWKIFGRTDRLVVKRFEEESNFAATLVVDHSASMGFSHGGRLPKVEYAKTMAAALAHLLIRQRDAVGVQALDARLAPSARHGHLERIFSFLEPLAPQGVWSSQDLAPGLGKTLLRRGLVIILSDLMHDEAAFLRAMRMLHAHKSEVVVFQILDPAERDLPFGGTCLFRDMETGETLRTDAAALRAGYRAFVDGKIAHLSQSLRHTGIDFLSVTTDMPFDRGLGAYLSWRDAHI